MAHIRALFSGHEVPKPGNPEPDSVARHPWAAKVGRREKPLRKDWESVKDQVMFDAVLAKFTQNPDIARKLLSTGDAYLIEHTKNDFYWADGGDGSGKNRLGEVLMAVRDSLRA